MRQCAKLALHGKLKPVESESQLAERTMSNLADQLDPMRTRTDGVGKDTNVDRLTAQLEEMRIRMNGMAMRESHLAAELNAAVRKMDDELLHAVRSMSAEHEARRANILNELAAFAAQLDGLPDRRLQRPPLGSSKRALLSNSPLSSSDLAAGQDDKQRTISDALNRLNLASQPH